MPHSAYDGWQRRCLAEMMRLLRHGGVIQIQKTPAGDGGGLKF